MTSDQAATTTAAETAPAARAAPQAPNTVALPGTPFPLGATQGEHLGLAGGLLRQGAGLPGHGRPGPGGIAGQAG